jgi:hypothetical protein
LKRYRDASRIRITNKQYNGSDFDLHKPSRIPGVEYIILNVCSCRTFKRTFFPRHACNNNNDKRVRITVIRPSSENRLRKTYTHNTRTFRSRICNEVIRCKWSASNRRSCSLKKKKNTFFILKRGLGMGSTMWFTHIDTKRNICFRYCDLNRFLVLVQNLNVRITDVVLVAFDRTSTTADFSANT